MTVDIARCPLLVATMACLICPQIDLLPAIGLSTPTLMPPFLNILYSRKIWRGIKFGGSAVYLCNHQIKIHQYFLLAYIHMAIPYQTAKFKSTNIFAMAILGPTTKFNSRQYFWLYGSSYDYCQFQPCGYTD